MIKAASHRTSVSAIMGTPVTDSQAHVLGRVREFAVDPVQDTGHIAALILNAPSKGQPRPLILVQDLRLLPSGALQLKENATPQTLPEKNDFLLLDYELLDQQIIDVHGHKVVRVNDVDLVWEGHEEDINCDLKLRIAEVEVGARGAVRRLLKGVPQSIVDATADRFKPRCIPWEFVDLIERDPARRVRLKIEQNRLSHMHPSDIADILAELAPAERDAVFSTLDEEIAAEALEEVDPRLQAALIENLDDEKIAGIIEEMDPGAAADLLSELSDEKSEAILEEMDPEDREEVEELLEFPENSAAGRMTTDFVSLPETATVADAIDGLRNFEGDIETITDVYLVDEEEHFRAAIPLSRLILSESSIALATLAEGRHISTTTDANGKHVAELFDKYNLRSLPVLDDEHKLVGVIHAEQVIALLREGR